MLVKLIKPHTDSIRSAFAKVLSESRRCTKVDAQGERDAWVVDETKTSVDEILVQLQEDLYAGEIAHVVTVDDEALSLWQVDKRRRYKLDM